MNLSIGHSTDPGPREGENQDSLLTIMPPEPPESAVLIVCDGMGGAQAGEQASQEAVRVIRQHLIGAGLPAPADVPERLEEAITAANTAIYAKASSAPEFEGMGCTSVIAVVIDDLYWIANVGDSRAYLIRDGKVQQITDDHTWLNARVQEGMITREQAAGEYQHLNHVLDRALGASSTIEVDVWPGDELLEGDFLLLCSDGLYSVITPEMILEAIPEHSTQQVADTLIELALAAPTHDNVSVALLHAAE